MRKSTTALVLVTGLLAGTADILFAFLYVYLKSGTQPETVLRYIASGAMGRQAFTGGDVMIVWGLLFHYIIAMTFTILFFLLYSRIKWIAAHKISAAILYGLFVWTVMNLVVVPLSRITPPPLQLTNVIVNMTILIIAIGLPLVLMAGRFYSPKTVVHETV